MKEVKIVEMGGDKIQYLQKLLPLNYQENNNEVVLAAVEVNEIDELVICGVLIVQMNGFSSEVIHIEVEKAFRRERIATQLIDYFIQLQFKIGEVWPITISYIDGIDHEEFVGFIENRKDFDIQYDCMIYHIQADERKFSKPCRKLRRLKKEAELFMRLPQYVQKNFRQKIEAKGIPYLQNVDFNKMEPSLCYCIQRNGEVVAALLVKAEDEQTLDVVFAYADPGHPLGLAIATASALRAVDKKYPEAVITVVAAEEKSDVFVRRAFPDCVNKEAIFRAVWNYKAIEGEDGYVSDSDV